MAYYYSPFRKGYGKEPESASCAFCDPAIIEKQVVRDSDGRPVENEHYHWIVNFYPRMEGHTLIMPKVHVHEMRGETPEQLYARQELITYANDILRALYPEAGIEVFLQTGGGSQSTVKHLHWHVVPSLPSDPLRGWEKLEQFTTTEEGKERVVFFPIEITYALEDLQKALAPHVSAKPWSGHA